LAWRVQRRTIRAIRRRLREGSRVMADFGVAITWGEPKVGREKQSLEVWSDGATLNDKAVADGRLERWDAVLFEPSGATPAGAIRLYGTRAQVEAFIESEDFASVIRRAQLTVHALAFRRFLAGDALIEALANFSETVNSLS
jgi:hypothetical protein